MSSQEQANRTADRVLEHGVMKRREALLRHLHRELVSYSDPGVRVCYECDVPYPCETIQILDSRPPVPSIVTEA